MKKQAIAKNPEIIDISYLSSSLQQKVNDTFDRYFNLGLVTRTSVPDSLPIFPTRMSSVDNSQLSDLHSHYTAMYGFTSDKYKFVKAVSTVLAKELSEAYNSAILRVDLPKTAKVDQIKAATKQDLGYSSILEYVTKTTALQEMILEEKETLEKQMMSLAREIRHRETLNRLQ
jgi:hypothetical protein